MILNNTGWPKKFNLIVKQKHKGPKTKGKGENKHGWGTHLTQQNDLFNILSTGIPKPATF